LTFREGRRQRGKEKRGGSESINNGKKCGLQRKGKEDSAVAIGKK
jgi:hypothetical protein